MKQYIGCDTHLRYSVFRILSEDGVMDRRCGSSIAAANWSVFWLKWPPAVPWLWNPQDLMDGWFRPSRQRG
jgi:hypothetical protein